MTAGGGTVGSGCDPELIVVAVERGTNPPVEHAYDLQLARLVTSHPVPPQLAFPDAVRPWADPPQGRRCSACTSAVQHALSQTDTTRWSSTEVQG